MKLSTFQIDICDEIKFRCENCIQALNKEISPDLFHMTSFRQCADLSKAVLQCALQQSMFFEQVALLCIGLCQECVEICDQYPHNETFSKCAAACKKGSQLMCLQISDTSISELVPDEYNS